MLFSEELCGLKHAVVLQRCDAFRAGRDLHLRRLSQRNPSSVFSAADFCNSRRPMKALISWVVYSIDLSLPQVVTLGKNSRGYHYILANLVSSDQAAPRRGAGPVLFCMCINANLHALYLSSRLLCFKKNPPYFSPFIIFVVFVHQS